MVESGVQVIFSLGILWHPLGSVLAFTSSPLCIGRDFYLLLILVMASVVVWS